MWYDETIKNMAFQRDKVLGSCMTEDEEEAKMLNAILDELKLNALVITDPYNMRHVSGFRGEGALYISAAQKVLITDSRYTEQAGKESDFTVIEECRGHNRQTILNNTTPHNHFVCTKCHSVLDLEMGSIDDIVEVARKNFPGRIDRHCTYFYGICADCMEESEEAS